MVFAPLSLALLDYADLESSSLIVQQHVMHSSFQILSGVPRFVIQT